MSKKTKSTTDSTATTTPTNPEWVTSGVQGLQSKIDGLLATDPNTLVPGASALQTQAFDQAGALGGWKAGNTAAATAAQSLIDNPAQATSRGLLDVNLDGYQNPFQKDVIDTTLAGFDEQAGMKRAELAAQQARGQKFSGSGSAIERMLYERGSNQDRAATEAGLRSTGFDKATGLATGDLNREAQTSQFNAQQANAARQAGAGLLGDMSNSAGANDRADIGVLSDQGAQQREIERQKLAANPALLQLVSSLQGAQPYQLFQGNTKTGHETSTSTTSDPMGAIGGVLGGLGSLAGGLGAMGATLGPLAILSDKRLKEDIKPHGKDSAGRPMVSYRYKGEPKDVRRVGHLAQEVEKTDPQAIKHVGKYKAIDYGLLGEGAC